MERRVADAFERGVIVRPSDSERPDLVHLVQAIAHRCGLEAFQRAPAVEKLLNLIGSSDHLVFILLDGMGMNVVERLSGGSFMASHLASELLALCPSTTACALTSVATGQWPAQHAVTGWFTHLPELGITATLLPFTERVSQQPLGKRGLTAQSVFPIAALNPRLPRRQVTLMPEKILDTTYAVYSRGGTPALGYKSFPHAMDQMAEFVARSREPTYTHLYVPDVDSLIHKRGVEHASVAELVEHIDQQIARLAGSIVPRARIIVSADHGLIDVAPTDHSPIFDGDPMLSVLRCPPSGDARMPLLHVKPGRRDAFVEMFQRRFSEAFALLDMDEVERQGFFGPPPMSPIARQRFGDFVAVALRPATLLYHPPAVPADATRTPYVAQHGGLSRSEMRIPLIIA